MQDLTSAQGLRKPKQNKSLLLHLYLMMKLFLFVLLSVVLFSGCQYSNYTYIQTPLNVPHLKKKGDAQVDVHVSVKGLDLQTSYAFTNHMALMVNANDNPFKLSQNPSYKTQAFALDMAAGYYTTQKKYTYSLFGGVGIGDLSCHSESEQTYMFVDYSKWDNSSHYQKIFIQSSITKQVNEHVNFSFALRASGVRYDSYAYKHASYSGHDVRHLNELIDTVEIRTPAVAFVIDPAFVINLKADERVSFYSQVGLVWGIGFGSLTERKMYDFTGYKSSNSYVVSSTQASPVSQPVVFPLSLYIGMRFRICR